MSGWGSPTRSDADSVLTAKSEQLATLYGEVDEPYLAVETLADRGLIAIAEALDRGEIGSLSDLLPP